MVGARAEEALRPRRAVICSPRAAVGDQAAPRFTLSAAKLMPPA